MKINPLFQSDIVSRYVSGAAVVPRETETSAKAISASDTVELSSGAQSYAQLLRKARTELDATDSKEAPRVEAIKASMDAGVYEVSDDDLVDALTGKKDLPKYG